MSTSEQIEAFCRDVDRICSDIEAERWKRRHRKKKRKKEMPIDIRHGK